MTLIVAVFVPTGIAMSADSRSVGEITQEVVNPQDPQQRLQVKTNIVISEAADKLFVVNNRFGVATTGDALVDGLPIAHYIEIFRSGIEDNPSLGTQEFADKLLSYFRSLQPIPNVSFIVAGYDGTNPRVLGVGTSDNSVKRLNILPDGGDMWGISRGGDPSVVNRLLSDQKSQPLWPLMNLQDAVDFSRHLIRTTIDQMRFEPRFATIGGPIDTLVITTVGARFLAHKSLTAV